MKGFVVTMDIAFATLVAVLGIFIVHESIDAGKVDVWRDNVIHKLARDTITVMDRDGTLLEISESSEAAGESLIVDFLNSSLPATMGAEVTLTIFTDTDNDDVFEQRSSNPVYQAKYPTNWNSNITTSSRRVFVNVDNNDFTESEFGIAKITLGVR